MGWFRVVLPRNELGISPTYQIFVVNVPGSRIQQKDVAEINRQWRFDVSLAHFRLEAEMTKGSNLGVESTLKMFGRCGERNTYWCVYIERKRNCLFPKSPQRDL